jgi:hypothetical protein
LFISFRVGLSRQSRPALASCLVATMEVAKTRLRESSALVEPDAYVSSGLASACCGGLSRRVSRTQMKNTNIFGNLWDTSNVCDVFVDACRHNFCSVLSNRSNNICQMFSPHSEFILNLGIHEAGEFAATHSTR